MFPNKSIYGLSCILLSVFFLPMTSSGKTVSKQFCFGAVGKQCAIPGSVKGKPSPLNMVACSKVEKGKTNCWISPGSIEHDNCCFLYPNGAMCSSETKNDGHCVKVWAEAYQDINKKLAWYHIFNKTEGANLKFVKSKRMKKYGGLESQSTLNLCAPGGTKLLARYDSGFCCSGKAKKQGETMTCSQETVAKKPAQSLKKAQKAFAELEKILKNAKVPAKKIPAPPQTTGQKLSKPQKALSQQPVAQKWPELSPQQMLQAQKLEQQIKEFEQQANNQISQPVAMQPQTMPPPPQLSALPEQYRQAVPPQQRIVEQQRSEPVPMAARPRQESIWNTPPPPSQQQEPEYEPAPQPQYEPAQQEARHETPAPPPQEEMTYKPPQREAPEETAPPPSTGQPCNPNIPKYSQPGCVE